VYDTKTGDCVVECLNAHNANVLSLIPLYNSTVLVSSSADTSIRMWSSKNGTFNFASIGLSTMPSLSSTSPTGTPEKKSKASARIEGAFCARESLSKHHI
jgi:WD40 repeat protein